jgi:hypothetical protein
MNKTFYQTIQMKKEDGKQKKIFETSLNSIINHDLVNKKKNQI